MRARLPPLLILFSAACSPSATEPAPPLVRLVDQVARARVVEQRREAIEPETLRLEPGSVAAPPGFRLAGDATAAVAAVDRTVVGHFVAPEPAPLRIRIEVPVAGGRDAVVRAIVRDPASAVRLLVEHAPAPEQPEPGWHRATEERATGYGGRVRFDWREDVPPGRTRMALLLEADRASDVTLESLTVREADARDSSIVEGAPAVALHGLVERPVDGVQTVSARGTRRLEPALLSAEDGRYEWALPGWARRLDFESAIVPRGASGAPLEMRVEIETAGGWQLAWRSVRGEGDHDGGGWRATTVNLPSGARALRLSTHPTRPGRSAVVAWGDPMLRPEAAPRPPNVLLITLDAVRPDHLNAYGYAKPTSRFLAQLAAKGARFDDVTAQRGHTWASTTSLVTGLAPDTSGVIARGARSLRGIGGVVAEFAEAGYTTGRIGSPDLPRGQIPGFDFAELADLDVDVLARMEAICRAAQSSGHPLFLWVHLANAHYPWRVADEFNRFDPGYTGRFASGLSRAEFRALENAQPIGERERQHLVALYDGAILQMDVRLGRTMAALSDAHFFDDAVVAVTADHGTHLGEHGLWFLHSTPWHASLKVPLVLFAPGRVPPGIILPPERGRVLLTDLGPTLLDLAGLRARGPLDGVSLRPMLSGARMPSRTTVTRFQPASYALVENDRYELFWNPRGEAIAWPGELSFTAPAPRIGLYDRFRDPNEENDLRSEEPLIVGALRAEAEAGEAGSAPPLSTEARQLLRQAGYADDD